jgi:hypothetical protein
MSDVQSHHQQGLRGRDVEDVEARVTAARPVPDGAVLLARALYRHPERALVVSVTVGLLGEAAGWW